MQCPFHYLNILSIGIMMNNHVFKIEKNTNNFIRDQIDQ